MSLDEDTHSYDTEPEEICINDDDTGEEDHGHVEISPDGEDGSENAPLVIRERLTFQTLPRIVGATRARTRTAPSAIPDCCCGGNLDNGSDTLIMEGHSYTVTGNYKDAEPAKPAKPFLEVGLTGCEDKAIAVREILNKLQFGDSEDESACFVRRIWRETSTFEDTSRVGLSSSSPLLVHIATIAERTASLEASLEEAFDGLRLRLQELRQGGTSSTSEQRDDGAEQNSVEVGTGTGEGNNGNGDRREGQGEGENEGRSASQDNDSSVPYYRAWDEETSILNNPLNYDIWNELEDGPDAGPTITARINIAERRSNNIQHIRGSSHPEVDASTSSIAVGTDPHEGAELDDDTTDDEEISNYLQFENLRAANISCCRNTRNREFLREMGMSEDMGWELFDMFSFPAEEFRLPSAAAQNNAGDMEQEIQAESEMPAPLFPRCGEGGDLNDGVQNGVQEDDGQPDEEDEELDRTAPCVPLADVRPCAEIILNGEDDRCSRQVYLEPNNLNFPIVLEDEDRDEQQQQQQQHSDDYDEEN